MAIRVGINGFGRMGRLTLRGIRMGGGTVDVDVADGDVTVDCGNLDLDVVTPSRAGQ